MDEKARAKQYYCSEMVKEDNTVGRGGGGEEGKNAENYY